MRIWWKYWNKDDLKQSEHKLNTKPTSGTKDRCTMIGAPTPMNRQSMMWAPTHMSRRAQKSLCSTDQECGDKGSQ